ncbi:MAG: ankyrin repeat domain-containing protein [Bacteroidota bacterium]
MRAFFLLALFICSNFLLAQESNIFLDRSFWKTSPDIKTVEQKIAEGNDPVALNPFAFDAVVYATLENAPFTTIKHLLSIKGNEVNKITHDGRNYLMWAAYKGNLELMQYLIDQGSQTDIVDDHGYNLMTFAAVAGQQNPAVYDVVLKNGGKINDTNRAGANSLLLLSMHLEGETMLNYFKEKGLDLNSKDHEGNGLFNYAAKMGNIKMMDKYIEMGLDHQNLNKNGGNAMIFASQGYRRYTNPLNVYEYLESKGVEPNVVTKTGKTPLHGIAYRTKDFAIFEYFINRGVDINQADDNGNTAFINAVSGSNNEIAKQLLPQTKDINAANDDGYSALTYAVRRNNEELFELLLTNNADVQVVDKKGNNLMYHAFDAFDKKEKDIFEKHIAGLRAKNVSCKGQQAGGNTLLHLAVEKGNAFLIDQSIEWGVNIDQKNNDGLTPLHLAAMKAKNNKVLIQLLGYGADKNILTDFDESAFDLALENELLGRGEDVQFLKRDSK